MWRWNQTQIFSPHICLWKFFIHFVSLYGSRLQLYYVPENKYKCAYNLSQFSSVQFSSVQSLVMSESLWPHEPQHARPPCPSPTTRVYPKSCPLSRWCHPTISSSVVRFSCLQSFPTSGSFQMSQIFASGGQNTGVSAWTSVLPMNTQDRFPLGWISLQSKGLSSVFSNTTVQKHQFFCAQASL